MNRTEHTGRLSADPKLYETENKSSHYCKFALAVRNDHAPKKPDGKKDWNAVEFLQFIVWGDSAEAFVRAAVKGTTIEVVGRLSAVDRMYDGVKRSEMIVTVEKWAALALPQSYGGRKRTNDDFREYDGSQDEIPGDGYDI